ncbi:hypothetical protein [Aequorivita viscosa]|uniref:hypothetical protein n=1 Tax=Aequorivita viscosa TaxID=797419 RepID=UPI001160875D|nr:hypothetical protein [Aequorivita viscosa]
MEKEQTGLSIPNIVGSVRLNSSSKNYSISDFLTDVANENFEILISECPDINELVFGKFKNWDAPKNYYQHINSIYFSKSNFRNEILDLKSLAKELENQYYLRIENQTYSKENGSWVYLTLEDEQNHFTVNQRLKNL